MTGCGCGSWRSGSPLGCPAPPCPSFTPAAAVVAAESWLRPLAPDPWATPIALPAWEPPRDWREVAWEHRFAVLEPKPPERTARAWETLYGMTGPAPERGYLNWFVSEALGAEIVIAQAKFEQAMITAKALGLTEDQAREVIAAWVRYGGTVASVPWDAVRQSLAMRAMNGPWEPRSPPFRYDPYSYQEYYRGSAG